MFSIYLFIFSCLFCLLLRHFFLFFIKMQIFRRDITAIWLLTKMNAVQIKLSQQKNIMLISFRLIFITAGFFEVLFFCSLVICLFKPQVHQLKNSHLVRLIYLFTGGRSRKIRKIKKGTSSHSELVIFLSFFWQIWNIFHDEKSE